MMKINVAIVSHGHDDLIMANNGLKSINEMKHVNIIIKDNIESVNLKRFCDKSGFQYLSSPSNIGFGENNNTVFESCQNAGMCDEDWFLVVNPDVTITLEDFQLLQKELENPSGDLLTVNLFKNHSYTVHEQSIRHFPGWLNALSMFAGKPVAPAYDKSELKDRASVEWASGAFLIFKAGLYKKLGGFDKKYFMYYEDVDICYRARKQFNTPVTYLKNVKAVHAGAYANRNIFSKHFRWYLSSLFKFLWSK